MENQTPVPEGPGLTCPACGQPVTSGARFCNHCGASLFQELASEAHIQQGRLYLLAVFFGMLLITAMVANLGNGHSLAMLFVLDGLFVTITVGFAIYLRREIGFLLRWPRFSLARLLGYGLLAVVAATLVHYSVQWMNRTMFDSDSYYYFAFSHLPYAKLVTILVIALEPALFEELAFRGIMQQGLLKVVDYKQAIFISAFLFALLHMSFISFFWLLPFAWLLGWVRWREETLWYGVWIHFCFNATGCFLEFFELHLFH